MKLIISTLSMFLLTCTLSLGQLLDIRAYLGLNVLQLSNSNSSIVFDGVVHNRTTSGKAGYQLGAGLSYGNRLYFHPGFQHTVLNTKMITVNTENGNEFTDESTLKVFSIPLRVGFRLINPEAVNIANIRFFGGLNGHHIISVKQKVESGIGKISIDDYSDLIINADLGMGLDVLFFFLEAGYEFGLTPLYSGANNGKANAFYINIGARLTLQRKSREKTSEEGTL